MVLKNPYTIIIILELKRKSKKITFKKRILGGYFFLGAIGRIVVPSIIIRGTYESCPVKENHIGSAVTKILRYRQTNILLLFCTVRSYTCVLAWMNTFFKLSKQEKDFIHQ